MPGTNTREPKVMLQYFLFPWQRLNPSDWYPCTGDTWIFPLLGDDCLEMIAHLHHEDDRTGEITDPARLIASSLDHLDLLTVMRK